MPLNAKLSAGARTVAALSIVSIEIRTLWPHAAKLLIGLRYAEVVVGLSCAAPFLLLSQLYYSGGL